MEISFLIVTRNRPKDLKITLDKLKELIDTSIHEVLVCIDGCQNTKGLIQAYDWVQWTFLKNSISASPSRNVLYKKAIGNVLIGLDDDAHPLSYDFIKNVQVRFRENKQLGIIAFQEVRGIFNNDKEAQKKAVHGKAYKTNEFVGCGFAITGKAYKETQGFPVWMDIYGEESAVSLEALNKDYDILYDYDIQVNHRVDVLQRKKIKRNYFRFEHQLKNSISYYVVYYRNPTKRILKLLWHNFKKYALKDINYFKAYFKVCICAIWKARKVLSYRNPVSKEAIEKKKSLPPLNY